MDTTILNAVEVASGRIEKERLLATVDAETVKFMKWGLDPMITFGVTFDEEYQINGWLGAGRSPVEFIKFWDKADELCEKLSKRVITGNAAQNVIRDLVLVAPTRDCVVWLGRVLNKDLRMGAQVNTLNNVFPGTIVKEVPCALANPYDAEKHELKGEWIVQPKLDGLRMVVMDGVARTRNGRIIESVQHIIDELMSHGGDEYVYDGEIMGATTFDEDSGKIRKKGMGPNMDLVYNCFDVIPRADWIARKTQPLMMREDAALRWFDTLCPKHTKMVPTKRLPKDPTPAQLFKIRDDFIALGYEGAMLKDLNAPYVFKRSDFVLKLKDFVSCDGFIKSPYEGRGRHKNRLGGFIVEFDGVSTRIGGGYTDSQRDEFWKIRDSFIGKCLEAQTQNKTKDGKLRFPVFICMRPDKDVT